jgi:putative flippase GtrA
MNTQASSSYSRKEKGKSLIVRFIKFNIIGFTVFLVGTAIFSVLFSTMGAWTWIVANAFGGVLQFSLISYFNTTKKGYMFNSCKTE